MLPKPLLSLTEWSCMFVCVCYEESGMCYLNHCCPSQSGAVCLYGFVMMRVGCVT